MNFKIASIPSRETSNNPSGKAKRGMYTKFSLPFGKLSTQGTDKGTEGSLLTHEYRMILLNDCYPNTSQ